ncbi:hypothetical protein PoB_003091700 [Plakobranchus ocellatus]|uniref:Uncharacterized protein n=1 Tax=Plakobranchus ocellatus TaxID=259542 RepID=A0AAV4ABL1_9GAST|nr:hypothetical protein PoB_003091700 [Plakobranchus ocellatus]
MYLMMIVHRLNTDGTALEFAMAVLNFVPVMKGRVKNSLATLSDSVDIKFGQRYPLLYILLQVIENSTAQQTANVKALYTDQTGVRQEGLFY